MFSFINGKSKHSRAVRGTSTTRRRPRLLLEALEDRLTPNGGPTAQFAITQDWGTGFEAQITVSNPANGAPVSNWQLAFDYSPQITSLWDAQIVSHVGTHYVIDNAGWNATLAPGGSVSFGFNGASNQTTVQPTDYVLDGTPLTPPAAALPTLSIANASVAEPTSGTAAENFTVSLSAPSSSTVVVAYSTSDGTAHAGSDYQASNGSLTFAPGVTSQTLSITVPHNSAIPADGKSETFNVNLSSPAGATLAQATAVGTIQDPAPPATVAASVQFAVTSDWGSGYNGQFTIANKGSQPINNWSLQFSYAGSISSMWNASIASVNGTQYTVVPSAWDPSIPAGGSVVIGFGASPGNVTAATAPTNFVVHSGSANAKPVAGNVSVSTFVGLPVTVAVLSNASDANGDVLTLAGVGAAAHGTVVANANGTATYTPAGSYQGSDSFTYTVSDGHGDNATGTVSVTVAPIPAPVAGDGSASTTVNQSVVVSVLSDASDAAGYTLTLASVGTAKHGNVMANPDGTASYTPAAGYAGADSFTYTVSDGHGGSATGTITVTVSTNAAPVWPQHFFSPYVDVTAWPTPNFLQTAQTQGNKFFNLAFVVAGPSAEPSWGGYSSYDVAGTSFSSDLQTEITSLRQLGGDVMVSFGGASNQELAEVITNVSTLQAAYQSVINTYNLTHIDFDIEGGAQANHAAVDRRSQALAGLQQAAAAAGKQLQVWFTLPVLPTGLTADGLYVLQSALKYGVTIGGVNIMAMDYGDNAAPSPSGKMGTYAIQSATSLFGQLRSLYGGQKTSAQLWAMVGITPMLGVNDIVDEVFTQHDAQQVEAFAQQNGLGELSFWSLNRDQAGQSSTGIVQQPFDFLHVFEAFDQ